MRRRWGRSTQHLIAGQEGQNLRSGEGLRGAGDARRRLGKPRPVVLCRKDSQACRRRGLAFDLLRKEF